MASTMRFVRAAREPRRAKSRSRSSTRARCRESTKLETEKRGHSKFPFLFSGVLVVLGLRSNQAGPPCEKPNQLSRRAFLD
jgi:hypothetical protein